MNAFTRGDRIRCGLSTLLSASSLTVGVGGVEGLLEVCALLRETKAWHQIEVQQRLRQPPRARKPGKSRASRAHQAQAKHINHAPGKSSASQPRRGKRMGEGEGGRRVLSVERRA